MPSSSEPGQARAHAAQDSKSDAMPADAPALGAAGFGHVLAKWAITMHDSGWKRSRPQGFFYSLKVLLDEAMTPLLGLSLVR